MRPVVYLLPGLLCDEAVWRAQSERLAVTHDVRVPFFFGYSSLPDMARSVLEVAPRRFSLAGHSMGGRVALEIMRLAPERVERLALLNTGIHEVRPGEAERRQALVNLAFDQGMEALAAAWVPPMVAPMRLQDAVLMDEITSMVCRATPEIFAGQIQALLDRPAVRDVLGVINCPVHVIGARQDGWSPLSQHEEIASLIQGACLKTIENCGHMSPMEQPSAIADILVEWLS
jgi:pimeloyl-ACP methyl ester carboxylesterase